MLTYRNAPMSPRNSKPFIFRIFIRVFSALLLYNLYSALMLYIYNILDDTPNSHTTTDIHPIDELIRLTPHKQHSLHLLLNYVKNYNSSDGHTHGESITTGDDTICSRFGFEYNGRTTRRRIFFGALIADDSWHTILTHAIEAHGLYHSVAFIESNSTTSDDASQSRKLRFTNESIEFKALTSGIFGETTRVTVDNYIDHPERRKDFLPDWDDGVEEMQRELIVERWKQQGMTQDDIGIVGDTDEFFSRDMMLAATSCDVPSLRPGQNCHYPKILGRSLVFEISPECVTEERRWYHPDMISGQCVDLIGNETLHKPGKRHWNGHGPRMKGYGNTPDEYNMMPNITQYPLWKGEDIRTLAGGDQTKGDEPQSAFHLHNFFLSTQTLRNKYSTYSHASAKLRNKPLGQIDTDLEFAINCVTERIESKSQEYYSVTGGYEAIQGHGPILFDHLKEYRTARQQELKKMILEDEELFGRYHRLQWWDSSKSVVIALASGYDLPVYKVFVGTLRATGYTGHIILGIAPNAHLDIKQYLYSMNVTTREVVMAEKCTYAGALQENGDPSKEQKCSAAYPDYKIQWGRFPLARDWLLECKDCTGGVMLTDTRDAYFQSNPFDYPFGDHPMEELPEELMVFEENPELSTDHWLTSIPVQRCRKYELKSHPMLCSGSTMGTRQGILDYIDSMVNEFDYWSDRQECRSDTVGDDQSIHNHLYYSKQLKNAVAIPHRTGPIHVVGFQADKIFRGAIEQAAKEGYGEDLAAAESFINNVGYLHWNESSAEQVLPGERRKDWRTWLPLEHELIDPKSGLILNFNGKASPQVHQYDRFGLMVKEQFMIELTEQEQEQEN